MGLSLDRCALALLLSGCTGTVVDGPDLGPGFDTAEAELRAKTYTAQAIVIGSGYGGSVAALRLGEKGVDTLVLERGRRWTVPNPPTGSGPFATFAGVMSNIGNPAPAPKPAADNSTWLNTRCVGNLYLTFLAAGMPPVPTNCAKTTGVLESVDGSPALHRDAAPMLQMNGVSAIVAAGVGGGSLVNNGITFRPTEFAWKIAYPHSELPWMSKVFRDLEDRYFDMAQNALAPEPLPADVLADPHYKATANALRDAQQAGYPTVPTYDPTTMTGVTTLASITDFAKVREEIAGTRPAAVINGDVWWGVNSGARKSLDTPNGYLGRAEDTGHVTVWPLHTVTDISWDQRAKLYVIGVTRTDEAYNVLETMELTTPNLIVSAGSLGTTKLLVRARDTGDLPRLNEHVGTRFSTNGGTAHLRMTGEAVSPIGQGGPSGMRIYDFREAGNPVTLENLPQRVPPIAAFAPFNNAIFSVGIGIPTATGTFRYDAPNDTVVLDWPADAGLNVYNRVTALYETMPNGALFGGLKNPGASQRTTLHPLGGVPLGLATNRFCKLRGYRRLYAVDGAVLPNASAAANPTLLITAMAERCMNQIVRSVANGDDAWESDDLE
jgi:cholesterol oxidase